MKALITGITGQDGAYLAQLLLHRGYEVDGAARHCASRSLWRLEALGLVREDLYLSDGFNLLSLDVTCSTSVNRVVNAKHYDEIYNLAAQSFVHESFISPTSTFCINTLGVQNFLDALKMFSPTTRFYQASTSEMFGLVNVEAQDERTPFHPRSPYAVAKAAAHYAVQLYREAYGLHASCGILFNHESPLRGLEFVTRKVTDAVARITTEKADHVKLGNLDAKRDWGHAQDYVAGMHLMLQQKEPGDYVLATGETHTVREMVEIAFENVGLNWKDYVQQDERYMRPSDVPLLCGDATKAREKLGWAPAHDFRALITQMVDFDLQRHGVDPLLLHAETDALGC